MSLWKRLFSQKGRQPHISESLRIDYKRTVRTDVASISTQSGTATAPPSYVLPCLAESPLESNRSKLLLALRTETDSERVLASIARQLALNPDVADQDHLRDLILRLKSTTKFDSFWHNRRLAARLFVGSFSDLATGTKALAGLLEGSEAPHNSTKAIWDVLSEKAIELLARKSREAIRYIPALLPYRTDLQIKEDFKSNHDVMKMSFNEHRKTFEQFELAHPLLEANVERTLTGMDSDWMISEEALWLGEHCRNGRLPLHEYDFGNLRLLSQIPNAFGPKLRSTSQDELRKIEWQDSALFRYPHLIPEADLNVFAELPDIREKTCDYGDGEWTYPKISLENVRERAHKERARRGLA